MIIFDTNYWLRYILNDIPEQAVEVRTALNQALKNETMVFIPSLVIQELYFVLTKVQKIEKEFVITALQNILTLSVVEVQDYEIWQSALQNADKHNSVVDSYLCVLAEQEKSKLYSFDKKLMNKTSKKKS